MLGQIAGVGHRLYFCISGFALIVVKSDKTGLRQIKKISVGFGVVNQCTRFLMR